MLCSNFMILGQAFSSCMVHKLTNGEMDTQRANHTDLHTGFIY